MHSKVQRSATDALCVMEMGQRRVSREGGREVGRKEVMLCVCTLSAFGKSTSRARASALHCGRVICTEQAEA